MNYTREIFERCIKFEGYKEATWNDISQAEKDNQSVGLNHKDN